MPTIRLAIDADLRLITSQTLDKLDLLPHIYIPTDDPDRMRCWGIARADGDGRVAVYERLFPGSIVTACSMGQWASRDDLLYHGAELAAAFVQG